MERIHRRDAEGAADLHSACLHGTHFETADLRGANLVGADLKYAYLGGANLRGANLAEARLEKAIYDSRTRWPADYNPKVHGAESLE